MLVISGLDICVCHYKAFALHLILKIYQTPGGFEGMLGDWMSAWEGIKLKEERDINRYPSLL